jgi:hypothetical protein
VGRRSRLIWTAYVAFVVAAVIVLVSNHGEAHPKKVGEQAHVLQGGGSILYRSRTPQHRLNETRYRAECAKLLRELRQKYRVQGEETSEVSCSVPKH